MTLFSILLKDKIHRYNNAINAIIDYYNIKKGKVYQQNYYLRQFRIDITLNKIKIKEDVEILKAAKVLKRVKLFLYEEKRPIIYFIYFGNKKLLISKYIYKFHTLTTLIKYF